MAKLIVNPTSASRREVALPRTLLSIGRDPGNDLVLADAMVSRRHAVIECRGNQYFIRDCNSSNGSLVNGDKVSERSLRDGDLVAIGTARLLFRDDVAVDAGAKVVQHPSSPRLNCATCGADYRKGDQFCRQCGATLAPSVPPKAICTACGTAVPLPAQFCTACGRSLAEQVSTAGDGIVPSPIQLVAPADKTQEPSGSEPTPPIASPPRADEGAKAVDPRASRQARSEAAPSRPPASREAALRAPMAPGPRPAKRFPDTFRERVPAAAATEPAGAMARLAAAVVDHILVALIQGLVLSPLIWYWWSRPVPVRLSEAPLLALVVSVAVVPVALVLAAGYFVYGWGVRGATPGKTLLGIGVESSDGEFPIGAGRATVRLFGYALSSLLLGIGHFMIVFGGRGLHDRIAGTRVVRRERL
jgi:uncharacterized RDD family membrane protein YckC/predicted nucleic acid-binding Zn ribbon protein